MVASHVWGEPGLRDRLRPLACQLERSARPFPHGLDLVAATARAAALGCAAPNGVFGMDSDPHLGLVPKRLLGVSQWISLQRGERTATAGGCSQSSAISCLPLVESRLGKKIPISRS